MKLKIKRILKTLLMYNKFKIEKKFVLIIAHADYLLSIGGTQKYIYEQTTKLMSSKVDVINVFPYTFKVFTKKVNLYGVYINKSFYGYYTIDFIIRKIVKDDNLRSVFLHHIKGWCKKDYTELLKNLKKYDIEKTLFIHDFYYITPSINNIYNNLDRFYNVNNEFELIDPDSNNYIKEWKESFQIVFDTFEKIVVPSDYFKRVVCKNLKINIDRIQVIAHLKLKECGYRVIGMNKQVRIAFLGYKAKYKGWESWEKMVGNCKNANCEFYHIGSMYNRKDESVKYISYSYTDSGINTAPKILNDNKIDIVVLWSLLPESYSYTLYEAIASGCFIITNKLSGNIAYEISKLGNNFGVVLENEEMLNSLINDNSKLIRLIQNKKKNIYEIKSNNEQ